MAGRPLPGTPARAWRGTGDLGRNAAGCAGQGAQSEGPPPRAGDRWCEITDFDPLDPETIKDPYPWYARLLQGDPVQFSRRRRVWIISRYDDVRAAAQAHSVLSSAEGVILLRRGLPMLLTIDRPEHARLRRIAARQFSNQALERRRPVVETIANRAVDGAVEAGEVDAVAEIAMPVPVDVIAELLGVPGADRQRFRAWSDRVVAGFSLAPGNLVSASISVLPAIFRLHRYFSDTIAARRGDPSDDLLSHLLRSSEEGQMTEEELFWFAFLLLVAGNETTTNLFGSLLLSLATQPEAYERLRNEPELIPSAVEEALRLHSPVQAFYRTALTPYRLGGATIPAGGRVLLAFAAANRDPRKYPSPEAYLVDRNPTDHLAFGSGIHFCLGAHLARMEATAMLRRVSERVERLELSGSPAWTANPALRGIQRFPLRLTPGDPQRSRASLGVGLKVLVDVALG